MSWSYQAASPRTCPGTAARPGPPSAPRSALTGRAGGGVLAGWWRIPPASQRTARPRPPRRRTARGGSSSSGFPFPWWWHAEFPYGAHAARRVEPAHRLEEDTLSGAAGHFAAGLAGFSPADAAADQDDAVLPPVREIHRGRPAASCRPAPDRKSVV